MTTSLRQRIALGIVAATLAVPVLAGAALASNSYNSTLYFQGGMSGSSRYYGASGCGCDGTQKINISYTMYVGVNKYGLSTSGRTWEVMVSHNWTWGPFSGSDLIGTAYYQPYVGYSSVSWSMVGNGNYQFGFLKDYTDGFTLGSNNVHMWSNG